MEENKHFDCEDLFFEQTGPSSPKENRSSGGKERRSLLLVSLLAAVAVIALVLSVALAFGDAHYARARTNELEQRLSELQNAFRRHKDISDQMEGEDEAGYEMETSEKLSSSLPKLRERVRRWTNGQAPIPACNCDPAFESVNEMRQCCCYNRTNFYSTEQLRRYDDLLRTHAAGHFTACIPSNNDIQNHRIAGRKIAVNLFTNPEKDLYIGSEEPWSKAPASSQAFEYKPYKHTLTIKQDGIYLLYVQVARMKFTFGHLEVNGVEWLRCQHRPATNEYDLTSGNPLGRESCSMTGVRPLLAGDVLRVRNKEVGFAIVMMPHCTYWGIYKLA